MEIHAPIRTAQRVDRVIERLLPIDAMTQSAQPVELVQLPFPTPDPGGSHLHHERHFTLRLRFQTHVLAVIALLERRVIIACALTNSWQALSKDYDCEQESDSIGLPRLRGSVVWWPSKRRRGYCPMAPRHQRLPANCFCIESCGPNHHERNQLCLADRRQDIRKRLFRVGF